KNGIRDDIIIKLKDKGIQTQIGTYALHMEKAFCNAKKIGKLENSIALYNNLITLPLYFSMNTDNQDTILDELSNLLI
ncbi:MAG: DegT/DnrJ/EryC1/StrS aminotransferase family protein, partial [Candidatus Methanofastidiosa archaeon]|nr:DegT/DnrJ/EryC1/StrS aminotransferase family protein [Candidatus Methanofastidiosa archaeon]